MADLVPIGIGALSRATGIPENTLRTWERRYGFPRAERTEGGHRLYSPEVVETLALAARALERGHRPGAVLGASREALRALLGEQESPADRDVEAWLSATVRLDGESLDSGLRNSLARLGLLRFLQDRAAPFLVRVGEAWSQGTLQIFHEHFASERLGELLASTWRPLGEEGRGPAVVCGTLPGEQHLLGLHMAAAVLALEGCRVVFVGRDTPPASLVSCAEQVHAAAVAVAVSMSADPEDTRRHLLELRAGLDPDVALFAGGLGAPSDLAGVRRVETLDDLPALARSLR
jgi:DNA-binding transcriptional MerR regulator/methylmalonyl-CoA mutase cobalamin-binding subunit